jgi:hypothetical protein
LVLWLKQLTDGFVVNRRKPRVQTPVVSRYPRIRLAFLAAMRPALDPV